MNFFTLTKSQFCVFWMIICVLLAGFDFGFTFWSIVFGMSCGHSLGCVTYAVQTFLENLFEEFEINA